MKWKKNQHVSPAMVEDKATERLKDKARDLGLISWSTHSRAPKKTSAT